MSHHYKFNVLDEESDAEREVESSSLLQPQGYSLRSSRTCLFTSWSISLLLLLLSCYLYLQPRTGHSTFDTDFPDARNAVVYERRTFDGILDYNTTSGLIYRKIDLSQPQYFGDPEQTLGIDHAWMDLMQGEYSAMTDEEAELYADPDFHQLPTGSYHFELDMFHSLHCLNMVRMALDKDFYSIHPELQHNHIKSSIAGLERMHLDHCMDQIMQGIQCHGDMTPVPMRSWPGFNIAIGVGREHTCRRFNDLQQWRLRRNKQMPALPGS